MEHVATTLRFCVGACVQAARMGVQVFRPDKVVAEISERTLPSYKELSRLLWMGTEGQGGKQLGEANGLERRSTFGLRAGGRERR